MAKFNSDVVFIDTSGQVRVINGDLTLRGNPDGTGHVIVGSGISLRPEVDCNATDAMDLGQDGLRWKTLFACSGNFLERPTVNGSGVLLQGEAAGGGAAGVDSVNGLSGAIDIVSVNDAIDVSENGQDIELNGMFTSASGQLLDQLVAQSGLNCTTLTFSASDGTDFTLTHGLDTEDFTWALWRTDVSPIRAVLPFNVSPDGADDVRLQFFFPFTGKIVITSCGGVGDASGGGAFSGVESLNTLTGDVTVSATNDGLTVAEIGNDIQLTPLFTGASGSLLEAARVDSLNGLTGDLDIISLNDGIVVTDSDPNIELEALFTAASGAVLQQKCEDIDTLSGLIGSVVDSLNGLTGDIDIVANNDGITVTVDGQDIELDALFTTPSGAIVDEALALATAALPGSSGSVLRLNQGIAEYYLSADTGSFTTTLTTIPLDTTVVEDSTYYSRSGGVVTINVAGTYKVSYGSNIHQTGGNSRSMTRHQATLNGSILIPQSEAWVYSRNNAAGEGSVHKTFFIELSASDTIEVESVRTNGGGTFEHLAGSNLSIEFVRFP